MAAPLVQRVTLDSAAALRELAQLERQLAQLNNPINVPVDIDVDGTQRAERQMEGLRREVDQTGDEFTQLGRKAEASSDGILRVGSRGVSAFTSLRGSIVGVAAALAAIQGVRILGNFAFDAVQSASNLEESLSKTNVVFGELSGDIQDFAKTAPQALGLSTAAALEATATFGNLFLALGLSREAAAELSPDIVQLAADLASFNNIGVDEAVEKLRSGLVGEVEPLRTLGVNLNAAMVEAKALELGLIDASGVVTEAGKVQARYALILEQTVTAQGDFARTAEGVANRQRTLAAEFENLKTTIGQALLPAFESLLDVAPQLLALIEGLVPAIQSFATSFGDAVETIQPFLEQVTLIQQGIGAVSDAFAASRAVVNQSLEIFTSLATLRLGDFFSNIRESGDIVGDFIDRLQDRQAITGLAEDLQAGADASEAFTQRLQAVAAANDVTSETFARLASTAGLSGDELEAAVRNLLENADAYKLDAQAVQALRIELARLLGVENAVDFARKGRGGQRPPEQTTPDTAAAILTEADALEILGDAADTAGVTIRSLLADQASMTPELQAVAGLLSTSTLKYLEQVDAIDALGIQIDALSGAMDAAQAALSDAEGNIVEDFSQFFENLQTELAKREAFESNLAILRALGLDNLAAVFDEAGLGAAGALSDAVANPREAQAAEAALIGQGTSQGDAYAAAVETAIAGRPVTQGLIDNIIQAAAEADSPEVQQALLALAESLQLEIPVTFQTPVAGDIPIPSFLLPAPPPQQGDAGRTGLSTVNVEQNFFTEPQPTTQTTRAAQEIAVIVGYR